MKIFSVDNNAIIVAKICDCCRFRAELHDQQFGWFVSIDEKFGQLNDEQKDYCNSCVGMLFGKHIPDE